jgi:O-antigen/teichoic acid export membrane protein
MLQRLLSHPSFAKYSKNLAWTYVGQLAAGVLTLVVSIFMAHTLDKNTYGSYKYILSLLALASAFSLTGLRVSVNRAAALFYKHTIATASKLYIRYISITVIIVLAIGLYYLYAGNIIFGSTVLLAGALSILTGKYSFYPMYLNGVGQFKTTTLYTFYGDVVTSATLLAVILLFPSIPALVIGYYVASFAVAYVFQKRVANALESHVSEPERDAEILSQAKHQSVANVFSLFVSQIDKLIVFQYIGAIELAIYSFAIAVPDFIKSFVKLISTLFFPALTHGTTTKKDHSSCNCNNWSIVYCWDCGSCFVRIPCTIFV